MFRRILVAVDFSQGSQVAFDMAVELARMTGAVLDVIHVFHRPKAIPPELVVHKGPGDQSLTTLVRERAQEELDAMLAKSDQQAGQAILVDGHPAECIVARARASQCDLVVVGTHGHTGLSHIMLGSTAEKVVHHCPTTVLCVRSPDRGADQAGR